MQRKDTGKKEKNGRNKDGNKNTEMEKKLIKDRKRKQWDKNCGKDKRERKNGKKYSK